MKKILELYKKYKEIINYLIFGVLTTAVSLVSYWIFTNTFLNPKIAWQLQVANVISWILAVLFDYFTNRKYVFQSTERNKLKELLKFTAARLTTLFLDMLIMWLGVTILKYNDGIIKLISQVLIVISNYIFSKIFVFNSNNK